MKNSFNLAPRNGDIQPQPTVSTAELSGMMAVYLQAMDMPGLTEADQAELRHGIDLLCDRNSTTIDRFLDQQQADREATLAMLDGFADHS